MSTSDARPPVTAGIAPSEHEATLQRILAAVERQQRGRGRLELATAIVLSMATLASTWCGYQAGKWSGRQSTSQASADTAERNAAENTIVGLQRRTHDGLILLEYWRAIRAKESGTAESILAHMSPTLRTAVQASIAGGILENPQAQGPLQRAEYRLQEDLDATAKREEAKRLQGAAMSAGQAAGQYVLLTLVFASVLFFGGIGGTFSERRIRMALTSIALLLFGATVVMLLRLPIHSG